jgi:L,D-peptidoglycan transpeptidase YkuD (ErfK/YbiS/YcfS/YnhG family)
VGLNGVRSAKREGDLQTPAGVFPLRNQGRGTAGCVWLPTSALLSVMRWERPNVVIPAPLTTRTCQAVAGLGLSWR